MGEQGVVIKGILGVIARVWRAGGIEVETLDGMSGDMIAHLDQGVMNLGESVVILEDMVGV